MTGSSRGRIHDAGPGSARAGRRSDRRGGAPQPSRSWPCRPSPPPRLIPEPGARFPRRAPPRTPGRRTPGARARRHQGRNPGSRGRTSRPGGACTLARPPAARSGRGGRAGGQTGRTAAANVRDSVRAIDSKAGSHMRALLSPMISTRAPVPCTRMHFSRFLPRQSGVGGMSSRASRQSRSFGAPVAPLRPGPLRATSSRRAVRAGAALRGAPTRG